MRPWENCGSSRLRELWKKVMDRYLETYYAPKFEFQVKPAVDDKFDIVREFADSCRGELRRQST
jgi:hypothetical protein